MSEITTIPHDREAVKSALNTFHNKFIDNTYFTKKQKNFVFKYLHLTAAKLNDMENVKI